MLVAGREPVPAFGKKKKLGRMIPLPPPRRDTCNLRWAVIVKVSLNLLYPEGPQLEQQRKAVSSLPGSQAVGPSLS